MKTHGRSRSIVVLVAASAAAIGMTVMPVARADTPMPQAITHQHFNFYEGPITPSGDGSASTASYKNPSSPICSTSTSTAANVQTDCEGDFPNNETSIAVNPTNSLNQIGSANDYQLALSSGGQTNETAFSRAHVTFDGGKSWAEYPIDYNGYAATGDPGVAFDAAGNAYLSTLGFVWDQGRGSTTNPDILVAHSSDGGKTWSSASRVAAGSGSAGSTGLFNDKEMIAAWGDGNAIVTWTEFNDGQKGSYLSSPIFDSVTHDGGNTWTRPTEISGSASFCVGAQGGTTCDQSTGSTPVVAADGSIYVSFVTTRDATNGRDAYAVVKVDPTTGQLLAGPFNAANLYDGVSDYPYDAEGRQTYQDSQFRTWSLGNIAADPTNASHLAVVWSDMRNSQLPAPTNPYVAKTNSDVGVSQSFDSGVTWSAPIILTRPNDQFFPWATYDTGGNLRIGFNDRSYDSANHKFGYTIATGTAGKKAGSLNFSYAQLTTTLSDPTQGARWFSGYTANTNFPHPTAFLGDYTGIATNYNGGVVGLWTDLRNQSCFPSRCGSAENTFFGAAS